MLESDDNIIEAQTLFSPGQVCKYSGPVTSLILEQTKLQSEQVFDQDAVLQVSMRDFVASLLRMVNLRNEYFIEQFNSDSERNDVALDLLSPGIGSNDERRGGILRNFNLNNMNAALVQDTDLHL